MIYENCCDIILVKVDFEIYMKEGISMYGEIKIFSEKTFNQYEMNLMRTIKSNIDGLDKNYLLNVNEEEYIKYLVAEINFEPLEIHFDKIYVSSYEKDIPAELFPFNYNVYAGKSYRKQIVKYHIPFSGDKELLLCKPNPFIMWTQKILLENGCISFEVINFDDNPNSIKSNAKSTINNIKKQYENLKPQMNKLASDLINYVRDTFRKRKEIVLKNNNLLSSLGVPIKMNEVSSTFTIPSNIPKKIILEKPKVMDGEYKAEPTIDKKAYFDILQIIYDVGKQFERLPSTYYKKTEEELRDHILLFLEPRFEGTATGETFNKTGKTDILLRYENSNLFIAECKFWHGQKAYLKTIDQLLSYLTWRDSKAAIILFCRNNDFSNVILKTKQATKEHPNYLGFVDEKSDTWLNYRFHINGDKNREVKLAILLFHIPTKNS